MSVKHAIVCFLAGVTLASAAGPTSARPVTYKVDLLFEKIVDGDRPRKIIRVPVQALSVEAVESMCASGMSIMRLARNIMKNNPSALGLTGNWMDGGGECVRDLDGNIEMTVDASSEGNS